MNVHELVHVRSRSRSFTLFGASGAPFMNTPFMNVHVQFTESDNVNMAVHQRPCCVYTTHARAHTLRSKPKACFACSPHTPTLKLLILHVLLINLLELRATLRVVLLLTRANSGGTTVSSRQRGRHSSLLKPAAPGTPLKPTTATGAAAWQAVEAAVEVAVEAPSALSSRRAGVEHGTLMWHACMSRDTRGAQDVVCSCTAA